MAQPWTQHENICSSLARIVGCQHFVLACVATWTQIQRVMIAALLPACLCHGRAAHASKAASPCFSGIVRTRYTTIRAPALIAHAFCNGSMGSPEKVRLV